IGNLPGAPGTFGSLLALVLLYFFPVLRSLPVLVAIFILGVLSAGYEERIQGKKDDSRIVIDEIFGILLVFWNQPLEIKWLILGFLLFRFFDVVKPLGIKKLQKISGGPGIMIDDLMAGFASWIILKLCIIFLAGG
ncbi:MAG: phosphatidylglycerophosphatase A, partial [Halanaerobiaceae bacterium]